MNNKQLKIHLIWAELLVFNAWFVAILPIFVFYGGFGGAFAMYCFFMFFLLLQVNDQWSRWK